MSRTPYDDFVDAVANLIDYHEPLYGPGDHRELEDAIIGTSARDLFFVSNRINDVAEEVIRNMVMEVLTRMDEWRQRGLLELRWNGAVLPIRPHGRSLGRDVCLRRRGFRPDRRCVLHLKPFKRGSAAIVWGYPLSPPESFLRAQDRIFPDATPFTLGGCEVWDGRPSRERVSFCPDCRAALWHWLQSHRPEFYLGREGWDRIRREYRKYAVSDYGAEAR